MPATLTIGGLLGHYRIDARLGAGGMGVVYRAYDTKLHRPVAIKVLSGAPGETSSAMLLGEARAASALNHPNICTIHEVGEADGQPYIVMEYVQGTVLKNVIPPHGFSFALFLRYSLQISDAAMHAHDNKIVHRDLKGSNIVVTPKGQLKVLDFGLARRLPEHSPDSSTRSLSLIQSGKIAGTPPYIAPEVLQGAPADARSDVWSLGILFYEMVCGHLPFEGRTWFELTTAVLSDRPVPALSADVPVQARAIVERCLHKDPARRYQNAGELHAALEEARGIATHHGAGLMWVSAAVSVIVVLALAAVYRQSSSPAKTARTSADAVVTSSSPVKARRAVAVLGFKNLSGQSSTAWLSTALSEMLTTELSAGEHLRTIPGENVARMKTDLALADADSFAPDTLARIRSNLGTDLVVLGSYVTVGERIRFDVRLQDASAGETIASVAEAGSEEEILELVSRIGTRLRNRLGVAELSAADLARVQASLPASPAAARLYAEGLEKLRLFDAQAARTLLDRSINEDSKFALAHSALATAWSALGYDERAKASAKRAYDLSADLAREERMWVEGRYHVTMNEHEDAIKTYQALFNFFPDNLEYGLELATVQTSAGKGKDALVTIDVLRRLQASVSADPRIDLAEAAAARALSDFKRQQIASARAATKAQAQGARLLVAGARLSEGAAWQDLGEPDKAIAANEEASQIYTAAGDRGGVSRAVRSAAIVLRSKGDLAGARRMYDRALATSREIGDRSGTALILNNIGNVLRQQGFLEDAKKTYAESLAISREIGDKSNISNVLNNSAIGLRLQGDLDGAKRNYAEALAIRRAIGEKVGIATTLNNLANVLFDEGDLSGAKKLYEESLALRQEIGDKRGVGTAWLNIAGVLRLQGDLEGSKRLYERAIEVHRETEDKSAVATALVPIGVILTEQAKLGDARKKYEEAIAIQNEIGEKGSAATTRAALAELMIESGQPADAEALARQTAEEFRELKVADDEAIALSILARSLLVQNKTRDADEAIQRATRIAGTSSSRQTRFSIGIAAARVEAASGKRSSASSRLRGLMNESKGFVGDELETRLVLGELEIASGNVAAGRARLEALEKEAAEKGFLLTARNAASARR